MSKPDFSSCFTASSADEWLAYTATTAFVSVIFCLLFTFVLVWLRFPLWFCITSSAGRLSDWWILSSAPAVDASQGLWWRPLFCSFEDEHPGRATTFPRA